MRQILSDQVIFDPTAVPSAAFTAAITGIITSNGHGLSEGDCVQVSTDNTLPDGLSASTNYYVIEPTTNTFKLSATRGGSAVAIADTGTGNHAYALKGRSIYIGDAEHSVIHLTFSGTPTMTVKVQGGITLDSPDFNAAQSTTNKWDYIDVIDVEDGASIDGDTGFACTGAADNRILEANVNGLSWITVAITAFTAGKVGVTLTAYIKG